MSGVSGAETCAWVAILPAAGSGERMRDFSLACGAPSKLLIDILGHSVIEHSLNAILGTRRLGRVIVPVPANLRDVFSNRCSSYPVEWIEGGATRQASVAAALSHLQTSGRVPRWVLIHDAARCLVKSSLIEKIMLVTEESGAACAAVPAVDSLCFGHAVSGSVEIESYIERSRAWIIQTPQAFRFDWLLEAHQSSCSSAATDDTSLVHGHHKVRLVEADRENAKITNTSDYYFAEAVLRAR